MFKISNPADANYEMLSILLEDGTVSPIADIFLKMIYNISDMKERMPFFSKKLILTVDNAGVSEDIKLEGCISFSINGWAYSDDEAEESDSGVDITDSFNADKSAKNTLLKYLNETVTLTLTY